MSTSDLERRIRSWYAEEIGQTEGAPTSLEWFLAAIPASVRQDQGLFGRRAFVLLAAALLVGLVAGALAVGSGVVKLPSLFPSPSVVAEESPDATPSSSAAPSPIEPLGLVAYNVYEPIQPQPAGCTPPQSRRCSVERIWVANADGTDAHELLPDVSGGQHAIEWSPDGSRLLYSDDGGNLVLTDLEGSEPEVFPWDSLCWAGHCANFEGVTFSPDGTRLAYAALGGDQGEISAIAILDLGTRQVTVLESTATQNATTACLTAANEGTNEFPRWSPDGTRLLVVRQVIGPLDENGHCQSIVFSVNADGTDPRVVVPSNARRQPLNASWSPDGSQIVFHGTTYRSSQDVEGSCDIYAVRPDGSELRALTSDGVSCWPRWTRDGRIVFIKWIDPEAGTHTLWIMDADGADPTRLNDPRLSALTAIGCLVCTPPEGSPGSELLWQPTP